jgi:hypothetical protein
MLLDGDHSGNLEQPAGRGHRTGGLIYRMLLQQAALLSYADAFLLMGILILLNIPVVLLMRGVEHNQKRRKEMHGLMD